MLSCDLTEVNLSVNGRWLSTWISHLKKKKKIVPYEMAGN